ncbi:O-antigen ligase family protein [Andreprevotia lacus]|uniref:O-antigen ligase family protein n=1 Tax=Andreprevotia lacus TaxID=1121000 RepID=UPI00159342FC|nr:O-antigen ligase family protein [Andreprevotia lacus]
MNTSSLRIPLALESARIIEWRGRLYALAIFLAVFAIVSLGASQADGGGSLGRQLQWLLLTGGAIWHLLQTDRLKEPLALGWAIWVGALVLLYIAISASWSVVPGTTFKRAMLLWIIVAMCMACFGQQRREPVDFLHWHYWPVGILLVSSLLVALAWPAYGVTGIGWRGVASHKNELGQLATLGVLIYATLAISGKLRLGLGLMLLAMLVLVKSQSSSCTMALAAALAVGGIGLLLALASRSATSQPLLLGCGLFTLAVLFGLYVIGLIPDLQGMIDFVFGLLGKSSTLTGRTELWALVLENMQFQNPWLGGGYGGFWNGPDSIAGYIGYRFGGGYVGQAHNGYIDLYNDLGWTGIGLLVLFLLTWLQRIFAARRTAGSEFYFHLMFFVFMAVLDITESAYWRTTQMLNIVLIASFVRCNTLAVAAARKKPS